MARRTFGQVRKLPSGRWHARYTGPDTRLHNAPHTFTSKDDARFWLRGEEKLISAGEWTSPKARAESLKRAGLTFGDYSKKWLAGRDLKPRTREHYQALLDHQLLPTFQDVALKAITSELVRDWHSSLDRDKPTLRAHAYGLLRTILGTAVEEEKIPANPCHIRGAGNVRRAKKVEPATLAQLEAIASAMPERYRPMALLSSWCALRFGEVTELRRKDLDLTNGVIHVRRGVVRVDGGFEVGTPKSEAGIRDVAIPPKLVPLLKAHRDAMENKSPDALLFPAADGVSHMAPSTLYKVFYPARKAAGRPDLRWHDLRHTGAVLAAQTGATLAELMGRLGHSTPGAAMRYQHAAKDRDAEIARKLSALMD